MGKYNFDAEVIERPVRLRNGETRTVSIKELSESQFRQRQNLLVDSQAGRGRGRGQTSQIRLDRQRKYDFANCVASWDLKLSDFKKSVKEDSEQDMILPIEEDVIKELPSYASEQIYNAIQEVNGEPEEDEPTPMGGLQEDEDDDVEHEDAPEHDAPMTVAADPGENPT